MIVYNWKAEFSESELNEIEFWKHIMGKGESIEKEAIVITEMANALDRYEAILNEMEEAKEITSTR